MAKAVTKPRALVKASSVPKIPGVVVSRIGLQVPNKLAWANWLRLGEYFEEAESGLYWCRGDWWNSGALMYGEKTKIFEEDGTLQGRAKNTWVIWGVVCKAIPLEQRRQDLSFSHHAELASHINSGRFGEGEKMWENVNKWLDWCQTPDKLSKRLPSVLALREGLNRLKNKLEEGKLPEPGEVLKKLASRIPTVEGVKEPTPPPADNDEKGEEEPKHGKDRRPAVEIEAEKKLGELVSTFNAVQTPTMDCINRCKREMKNSEKQRWAEELAGLADTFEAMALRLDPDVFDRIEAEKAPAKAKKKAA